MEAPSRLTHLSRWPPRGCGKGFVPAGLVELGWASWACSIQHFFREFPRICFFYAISPIHKGVLFNRLILYPSDR